LQAESELRRDLEARVSPLVGHVFSPFLWRPAATDWYTLSALRTKALVVTDRREQEDQWPWPPELLVEWDVERSIPGRFADVDLFHLHNGWTATSLGLELIGALPKSRFVVTFVGTDVNRHAHLEGNGERYRRLFEAVRVVVAPCEFLAQKLTALGCDAGKIRIIPWGVDPDLLTPKDPAAFSPGGVLRVCMLARMIELKGIDVAIEAVSLAAEEADVKLDVVGDGAERDRLLALTEEVNARHGRHLVRLHGDGDAMPRHADALEVLGASDCLVNCSRRMPDGPEETMSVAMLEAQMAGLPVIATRCGGSAEAVIDGETGRLAAADASPAEIARLLVGLALDRSGRIELGARAARRARRLFATSVVASAHDSLYGEVAADS
jgi:glycosyltransferase involved in cell wall biosynthesis